MSLSVGTGASISMRCVLSATLGLRAGLTPHQAILFNILDMTIGSIAVAILSKRQAEENVLVASRFMGSMVAKVITFLILVPTTPYSASIALLIGVLSHVTALVVNILLNKNDGLGIIS